MSRRMGDSVAVRGNRRRAHPFTVAERLAVSALKLSLPDRARLAEKLLLSLDAPEEEENLDLWVAEAARRLRRLRTGQDRSYPAAEVLKRARAAISCRK